jgi:predicted ATPase
MKRYVITGGPGIGKTTVIEILAARGFKVVPEAARMVIGEEQASGGRALPWIDLEQFQARVAQKQLQLEQDADGPVVIHDRGIIDGYAYARMGNVQPPEVIERLGRDRYSAVFILDPLPGYVTDPARRENKEEALRIHDAIVDAYKRFDYAPVIVPVLVPEERASFIVRLIGQLA